MSSVNPVLLREELSRDARHLWADLSSLAERWTEPTLVRLSTRSSGGYPKTFNDPVWGVVELYPWETIVLDSQLLQRLRGVRQLGMAHLVYPGAGHDRLEHARGVVEVAERMIQALERNAKNRRRFGRDRDETVPDVTWKDRVAVRLAGLLHDIGHGPFSHATEMTIYNRFRADFDAAQKVLRKHFEGITRIAPGEIISVLILMSEPLRRVFSHERFGAEVEAAEIPPAICARILGSRSCLDAGYLSGIISGPIDADKLDYMSRDCHHAGLPLGQDVTRLISKLEVVVLTPGNAPNPELKARAERATGNRIYEIGISQSGLGAYEQMIIGRVILYDRLYYHHKIRAAEAMVRCLISVAEEERGCPYTLCDLFSEFSDDTMVSLIGGELKNDAIRPGGQRAIRISQLIQKREIYYRGYAFAARYIGGLSGLPAKEQDDTRALGWRKVLKALASEDSCAQLAKEILDKAKQLAESVPALRPFAEGISIEHVIVDLPLNKVVVRGGDILTRTESGQIGTPNLFFDPERWSQAYEHQKQCGFVYTPRKHVPLISLASKIVFFDRFGLLMSESADRASKTTGEVKREWIDAARDHHACSTECAAVLTSDQPRLLKFSENEIIVPAPWKLEDTELAKRLADSLNAVLPVGLPATFHAATTKAISDLLSFVDMIESAGDWHTNTELSERQLQTRLRDHLRSREIHVQEGTEFAGGETDLLIHGLVVENKVRNETANPFEVGPHYQWQERRYSIAVASRVGFVVLAYKPAGEASILPKSTRIQIVKHENAPEPRAQIRIVIPWGASTPSNAKAPSA